MPLTFSSWDDEAFVADVGKLVWDCAQAVGPRYGDDPGDLAGAAILRLLERQPDVRVSVEGVVARTVRNLAIDRLLERKRRREVFVDLTDLGEPLSPAVDDPLGAVAPFDESRWERWDGGVRNTTDAVNRAGAVVAAWLLLGSFSVTGRELAGRTVELLGEVLHRALEPLNVTADHRCHIAERRLLAAARAMRACLWLQRSDAKLLAAANVVIERLELLGEKQRAAERARTLRNKLVDDMIDGLESAIVPACAETAVAEAADAVERELAASIGGLESLGAADRGRALAHGLRIVAGRPATHPDLALELRRRAWHLERPAA